MSRFAHCHVVLRRWADHFLVSIEKRSSTCRARASATADLPRSRTSPTAAARRNYLPVAAFLLRLNVAPAAHEVAHDVVHVIFRDHLDAHRRFASVHWVYIPTMPVSVSGPL